MCIRDSPYVETDPVCPISTYGRSKVAGEEAVRGTLKHHVILRTAWVYSEFGNNFLKTMLRLAETRDELRIVADQRGSLRSLSDNTASAGETGQPTASVGSFQITPFSQSGA